MHLLQPTAHSASKAYAADDAATHLWANTTAACAVAHLQIVHCVLSAEHSFCGSHYTLGTQAL